MNEWMDGWMGTHSQAESKKGVRSEGRCRNMVFILHSASRYARYWFDLRFDIWLSTAQGVPYEPRGINV